MSILPSELASIESRARVITTRSPDGGTMVWRVWHDVDQASHGHGEEAPTLVLLHGSYGSWTHWLRNIPSLATACRVVALDIPGFGDSGCAPADRSPPDLARFIADGWRQVQVQLGPLASNGSSRLFIGGFSLGTVYAGWLARCLQSSDTSSKVSGLVLLAPGGLGARHDRPLSLRPVGRLSAAEHEAERLAAHRHNLRVLMFGNPDKVDDLAVHIQDVNVSRARFRGIFTSRPDFLLEALSGMSLPVLGVWGEKDAFDVDVRLRVATLRSVAPNAAVAIVNGAGHWVGYEAPEVVNALVLDWIKG